MPIREVEEPRKLELISLVDVVFLLLIFFIVTLSMGISIGHVPRGEEFEETFGISLLDLPMVTYRQQPGAKPQISDKTLVLSVHKEVTPTIVFNIYVFDSQYQNMESVERLEQEVRDLKGIPEEQLTTEQRAKLQGLRIDLDQHLIREGLTQGTLAQFDQNFANDMKRKLQQLIQAKGGPTNTVLEIECDQSVPYGFVFGFLMVSDNVRIGRVDFHMKTKS